MFHLNLTTGADNASQGKEDQEDPAGVAAEPMAKGDVGRNE